MRKCECERERVTGERGGEEGKGRRRERGREGEPSRVVVRSVGS